MVACIDMAFSADMAAALSPSYQCFFKPPPSFLGLGLGLGLEFQRKGRKLRRHFNLVISAQLSNSFSFSFGLDSPVRNCFSFSTCFLFSAYDTLLSAFLSVDLLELAILMRVLKFDNGCEKVIKIMVM